MIQNVPTSTYSVPGRRSVEQHTPRDISYLAQYVPFVQEATNKAARGARGRELDKKMVQQRLSKKTDYGPEAPPINTISFPNEYKQVVGDAPAGLIDIMDFEISWKFAAMRRPGALNDANLELPGFPFPGRQCREAKEAPPSAEVSADDETEAEELDKRETTETEQNKRVGGPLSYNTGPGYVLPNGTNPDLEDIAGQNLDLAFNMFGAYLGGMGPMNLTKLVDSASAYFLNAATYANGGVQDSTGYLPVFDVVFFFNTGLSVGLPYVVIRFPQAIVSQYTLTVQTSEQGIPTPIERVTFEFPLLEYSYTPSIQGICNATSCPGFNPLTFLNCNFYSYDETRQYWVPPPPQCKLPEPSYPYGSPGVLHAPAGRREASTASAPTRG